MSVIHVDTEFAVLDEQKYYNNIVDNLNYTIRHELFEINSKFMPDSQFEAIKRHGVRVRKRRKDSSEQQPEDVRWILDITEKVRITGIGMEYFRKSVYNDNNKTARRAAEQTKNVRTPSTSMSSEQIVKFENYEKLDTLMCNGMISNWVQNSGNTPAIVENLDGLKFIIPPKATFHVGDAANVKQYCTINGILFDLVIADPPWFCKSVKRQKTYEMNEEILDQIDIPNITSDDALIAVWITNRKGVKKEMEDRFDKWCMELISTWKWLKVTTEGEPVYGFDKQRHKLPFESIVFAKKKTSKKEFTLPKSFTISSIPMAVNSHKPPLLEVLQHFGIESKQPLELFARSLLPSTHSIGFEPFLLQSEHVYRRK